jgi:hypothetical protein
MLACPLLPLLQQTASETSLLSTSDEFWLYSLYSDGFNMLDHNVLTKIFYRSSADKVEEFDEQYMFISSTSLNFQGCLLNTKWDESLQSISERYEELLVNCLCTERSGGSKNGIDIFKLTVYPLKNLFSDKRRWSIKSWFYGKEDGYWVSDEDMSVVKELNCDAIGSLW